jgi:hypothetical protein
MILFVPFHVSFLTSLNYSLGGKIFLASWYRSV